MNKLFLYFISFIYVFYKMRKRRRKTSTFFCSINFINNYHHFSNSFLVLLFCCLFLFVLCLLPVHGRSTQFDTGDVLIKTTLGKIRGFRQVPFLKIADNTYLFWLFSYIFNFTEFWWQICCHIFWRTLCPKVLYIFDIKINIFRPIGVNRFSLPEMVSWKSF